MDLQAAADLLGNVGEFIGAIAVVATLGYLAVQVNQNTRASKAATYSETTNGWVDYLQRQSVEDLEILIALASEPDALSNARFYRAYYLCRSLFRRMEHDYYQYKAGVFERDTWLAYAKAFEEDTFSNPGVRAMWKLQKDYLDPEFVSFADRIVERSASMAGKRVQALFQELLHAERQAVA